MSTTDIYEIKKKKIFHPFNVNNLYLDVLRFNYSPRERLFTMINELPTVSEIVKGFRKIKDKKDKS